MRDMAKGERGEASTDLSRSQVLAPGARGTEDEAKSEGVIV
jgi:hypothetical protein